MRSTRSARQRCDGVWAASTLLPRYDNTVSPSHIGCAIAGRINIHGNTAGPNSTQINNVNLATGTSRSTRYDPADSRCGIERTDAQCLQYLRSTDPHDNKTRIKQTKGGLLSDSYRWILDNTEYRRWRDDRQGSLLWIKGDPGKGKTMLLCGIINKLRKSKDRSFLLSFFFCQATDSRINSATAVLRGLIYLLVAEQPSLMSHVRERYNHAGRELFEDVNAWVAVTEISINMLQDPGLKETYLIINALYEYMTDKSSLVDLIGQQASVSSHVK